jgi:methyl-accepting chemotaxis protein
MGKTKFYQGIGFWLIIIFTVAITLTVTLTTYSAVSTARAALKESVTETSERTLDLAQSGFASFMKTMDAANNITANDNSVSAEVQDYIKNIRMMDYGCVILVNNKGNIIVNSEKNSYSLVTVAGLGFWQSVTRLADSSCNRVYAFDEKIDAQSVHIVASKDAATGWTLVGFVPTQKQIQPAIGNIIKNAVLVGVLTVIAGIAAALAITMFVRGKMRDEISTLIRNVEEKSAIITDEADKIEKISESTEQTLKWVTDAIQNMSEETTEQTQGYAVNTDDAVNIGVAVNMDVGANTDMVVNTEDAANTDMAVNTDVASNMNAAVDGMEELTELLDDSRGYVKELNDSSEKTKEFSNHGVGVVEEIMHKGKWSKDTAQMAKQAVDEMMTSVEKIKTTSAAIAHITEQTRLLARKASVEAAMAGNTGRGFSVAAEEIRKLAEKSQELTNEIEMILEEINTQSITMARTADFSIAITDDTNKIADEALKLFGEIKTSIVAMTEGIECIAELGVHIDRSRENIEMRLKENHLHKAEI